MRVQDNLRRYMERNGLKDADVALRCNLARPQITALRNGIGKTVTVPTLLELSKGTGASLDYLVFGKEPAPPRPAPAQTLVIRPDPTTSSGFIDPGQFEAIPLIDSPAALGAGRVVHEDQVEDHVIIRSHMLKGRKGTVKAVRVAGVSMEPILSEGDIVAIEERGPRIGGGWSREELHGKMAAVRIRADDPEPEITVKWLIFGKGTEKYVVLHAQNVAWQDEQGGPMVVKASELSLVGKVLWAWRSF